MICYLPDCTVSLGTSWVSLVLAGVTSAEIGRRYTKSPFFCPYRPVLTCICPVMFVSVLHNLGCVGLQGF